MADFLAPAPVTGRLVPSKMLDESGLRKSSPLPVDIVSGDTLLFKFNVFFFVNYLAIALGTMAVEYNLRMLLCTSL